MSQKTDEASSHESHSTINEDANDTGEPEDEEFGLIVFPHGHHDVDWDESESAGNEHRGNDGHWDVGEVWDKDDGENEDPNGVDELRVFVIGSTGNVDSSSDENTSAWSTTHNT